MNTNQYMLVRKLPESRKDPLKRSGRTTLRDHTGPVIIDIVEIEYQNINSGMERPNTSVVSPN